MIMTNRSVFALLLLTLLSFPLAIWAGQVTKVENYNYPLANGGKFTIEDANGTITIGSSDRNNVEITATKHAENQTDLDAIRIDIKQGNDSIEVRTVYLPGGHNGGVFYQVVLPKEIGRLVAKTANGSITAEGVGGDVNMKSENGAITATSLKGPFSLDTTNGSISAVCADLVGDGRLRTTNGSITLALPRSSDALIEAGTTVGRISSDLPGNKVNKGVVGETLEAKLGAGSHHLEAKTTNGSIRLQAR
jgi:DUF4097 and DUF4098 domain-containing protein YvlB